METIENIVLVGAGNVATHLGKALQQNGKKVVQVYSRTAKSARQLADAINSDYTTEMKMIYPGADLYIFSVSDDALQGLLAEFPHKDSLVAHTSGSQPMKIITEAGLKAAVLYPLQTFSKNVTVDFANIPICIEADTQPNAIRLHDLASSISNDIRFVNSDQREAIHVAAVFSCNFVNHLFTIADEILQTHDISFDILHPLIEETVRKAMQNQPSAVQTGPAARKDHRIISKHINKLSSLPDYRKIYTFMSESIMKNAKK
ncbi:MAG: Rossmann-like and DUF2520 domain-containing protein [Bacteroidota bacterium]